MIACLFLLAVQSAIRQTLDLVIPANTAYGVPEHERLRIGPNGIQGWTNPQQSVEWHGFLSAGALTVLVKTRLPEGQTSQLRLSVGPDRVINGEYGLAAQQASLDVSGQGDQPVTVSSSNFTIAEKGYQIIKLDGVTNSGGAFPEIESITLSGEATKGAHFNLKEHRNAASVSLTYPVDKNDQVSWFYNEVTPRTDPIFTQYTVCGFSRGYIGMQVNSRFDRSLVFAVRDGGGYNDPNEVPQLLRTTLVGQGDGVNVDAFGNEGTGGLASLAFPWAIDNTYRFLVGAKVDGNATLYTGYFFNPQTNKWQLIASFRAPKDGKLLQGLYSLDKNFNGINGDLERRAEFGNGWIGTADEAWKQLNQARFAHDTTGDADRLDYSAVSQGAVYSLRTGGFIDEPTTPSAAILIHGPGGNQPKDLKLPPIPTPPTPPRGFLP
jgi:hypothetical protein